MPGPILSTPRTPFSSPTVELGRAVSAGARVPEVALVATTSGMVASGTIDIPLSAFSPPLTRQQVEAEPWLHVQLPATDNAVRRTEVVEGPGGPALRVALENVEPGALLKMPIRLELGRADQLAQELPSELPEGSMLVSSGHLKLRVAVEVVHVDGTALERRSRRQALAQARSSLEAATRTEQAQREAPAMGARQLEGELAAARAAEAAAASQHATLRADVLSRIRGPLTPEVLMAVLVVDDVGALAAGEAALRHATPDTLATWAQHRERVLGGLSEHELERSASTLGGPSLQEARLAHERAQRQVTMLGAELEQLRARPTATSVMADTLERLRRTIATLEAGLARLDAGERVVQTEPSRYGDEVAPL